MTCGISVGFLTRLWLQGICRYRRERQTVISPRILIAVANQNYSSMCVLFFCLLGAIVGTFI